MSHIWRKEVSLLWIKETSRSTLRVEAQILIELKSWFKATDHKDRQVVTWKFKRLNLLIQTLDH